MRIIHLIDYFQPKIGYQETFLAREQINLGHNVFVVTSDRFYPFPEYNSTYSKILGNRITGAKESIEEGIQTIRLPTFEIPGSTLLLLKGLKNKIANHNPDVIHCHGVFSLLSLHAARLKPILKYKLIYDTHASHFNTDFTSSIPKKIYLNIYNKFFWNIIRKQADSIFAIGEDESNFLAETVSSQSSKFPVIHLGVDTNLFQKSFKKRAIIRKKLKIKTNETAVIFTGKVSPNKDVHILFDALSMLKNPDLKILIIGNGTPDYVNKLKSRLTESQQIWIDCVENSRLPDFYSAADIAVWPGDSTIAILEAISCSLPVILPTDPATEYLDQSRGITRFPRGNAKKLSGMLDQLITDKEKSKALGKNAFEYVTKNLSWKIINEQVMKLYT